MNENFNMNGDNNLPKATGKDIFILMFFIGFFVAVCAFGIYGFVSNLKSNGNEIKPNNNDVTKTDNLPEKNNKYSFLNYLSNKVTDDIEVIRYYYLDDEELMCNDSVGTYYVLREETFVNGVMIGNTAVLEVLQEEIEEVKDTYLLNHKVSFLKDSKTDDNYVLVKKSNNGHLIENGTYVLIESDTGTYDDASNNVMYLVNKNGSILKEFAFGDCWLAGIAIKEEQIEDRYYIETDTNVYDYTLDEFVEGHGPVIYPEGRYFDVHNDYFYWLDRLNNNAEYKYIIENGKLIEKQTKVYDIYNYGFIEVGCV